MHATSLQGFGYGDVVHQFEKRCKKQNLYPLTSFCHSRQEIIKARF
ncbi:MAG: hypothetical protein MGU50_05305 [Trichodesmium sp. MAG_R02]|nr:hypothetical protein [Trichodesmium sp. MAG_R02]